MTNGKVSYNCKKYIEENPEKFDNIILSPDLRKIGITNKNIYKVCSRCPDANIYKNSNNIGPSPSPPSNKVNPSPRPPSNKVNPKQSSTSNKKSKDVKPIKNKYLKYVSNDKQGKRITVYSFETSKTDDINVELVIDKFNTIGINRNNIEIKFETNELHVILNINKIIEKNQFIEMINRTFHQKMLSF